MNALPQASKQHTPGVMFDGRSSWWKSILTSLMISVPLFIGFPNGELGDIAIALTLAIAISLLAVFEDSLESWRRSLLIVKPLSWAERHVGIIGCAVLVWLMILFDVSFPRFTLVGILSLISLGATASCLRGWYTVARAIKEQREKWNVSNGP